MILSPLRDDKKIGSFFVNEDTGKWYDFSNTDGGDALSLYAKIKGIKNGEAYAEIMGVEYDPADDFYIEPDKRAAIAATLSNDELKEEYLKITEPTKNAFRLSRYGDMSLEPPKWLIKGILEDNALGVVFGAAGHGKSYFVLDIAACIASGRDFHGRKTKARGAVVYIAGEGHAGLTKRLRAWELCHEADLKKAPLYISHRPAALCDDEIMAHVKAAVTSVGLRERVALIIVDTWARNMAGDENSTVDTTQAIRAVDNLRAIYGCTGLIVHHSGQAESERGRGSSALRAALDVEYKVEIQNETMLVKNTKMKDGEPPEPMTFAFESIDLGFDDEDGDPVFSSALKEIDLSGIVGKPKKKGKIQGMILDIVKNNSGNIDRRDLRAAMKDTRDSSFFSALSSLLDSGELTQSENVVYIKVDEKS